MIKRTSIPRREELDHPEHYDDLIREYSAEVRYMPSALISQLYELAGHRCTICKEPFLEIHHIVELKNGGETRYDNLIVLCPNCHTRVHQSNVPTAEELRQYKLKQELAYELPVIGKITTNEKELLLEWIGKPKEERLAFEKIIPQEIDVTEGDETINEKYVRARSLARNRVGYNYLEEMGLIMKNIKDKEPHFAYHALLGGVTKLVKGICYMNVEVRLTPKGVKWVNYIEETGRLD